MHPPSPVLPALSCLTRQERETYKVEHNQDGWMLVGFAS
jgi:hypothetical protein